MTRTTLMMLLVLMTATVLSAQNYRCDWRVLGIGGGAMSSTSYRCGATAGQTAAGLLTGTDFLAVVGFWQADYQVGITERQGPVIPNGLVTRLEGVAPNPFRDWTQVRYSLAAAVPVRVVVHDLAGRVVRTLVNGSQGAGRYTAAWQGEDDIGRVLANGIYFCRFTAGEHYEARKLMVAR